jgi:hypothetical protein
MHGNTTTMDSYQRKKKSDKAKEKAGRPSQKHVRAYEAILEKKKPSNLPTHTIVSTST